MADHHLSAHIHHQFHRYGLGLGGVARLDRKYQPFLIPPGEGIPGND